MPLAAKVELAARLGFEPRQAESESAVLPLHYQASIKKRGPETKKVEPATGVEPVTACLQNRCSAIELHRRKCYESANPHEKESKNKPYYKENFKNFQISLVAPPGLEPGTN